MPLISTHEFLNIGRGESFIRNYYFGLTDKGSESKLFICLAIKNKQASAEIMSETMFEAGKDIFFNYNLNDDYKRFEATLKEINAIFEKFKNDSISGDIGTVHMVVGAIVDKTLHISQTGDSEAYLIRNKHISVISDGLGEGGKVNHFTNIASGEIETDDILVFCTSRLLRYATKNDLTKVFTPGGTIEKELGKLKSLLEIETLDQMGINIVKISDFAGSTNKKTERFQIQEIFTTIRNHPLIKKLSGRELMKKLAENRNLSSGGILERLQSLGKIFSRPNPEDLNFKKKRVLMALTGVILVLAISIFYLKISGDKQQLLDTYENTLAAVQEDIDKAYTVGITDKQKATEMLTQAEEKTKEILQSGYLRSLASERLNDIQGIKDKLDGIKSVTEPKLVADLSGAKSDINSIGLVSLSTHLAAYEPTAVHEVILSKIENEKTLTGGEEIIDGNFFADQNTVVFITKKGKVVEYQNGRFQFMDTQAPSWKSSIDIKSFGSKIYLLDSAGNQIWKYSRQRDNYSVQDAYFSSPIDLSGAIDMAIDASIYVLNQDGGIRRFYGGQEQELLIRKAPLTALKRPTIIYTEEETPNLYILEPDEKRVLIYSKEPRTGNLSYSYQIKFPTLNNIRDLLVDKKNSKFYLLADEKIYEESL